MVQKERNLTSRNTKKKKGLGKIDLKFKRVPVSNIDNK